MADGVRVCCLLFYVICICGLELAFASHEAELHPVPDFKRHTHIKLRIYHGREKRQIFTTKEKEGTHAQHLTVKYDLDGTIHTLDLKLNRDLLPKGYFHRYQENGSHVINKLTPEKVELCHYKGKIRGVPGSWAALSSCGNGFSGVIYDDKDMYYIEKNLNDSDEIHYMYKHSDIAKSNKTCGYSGNAVDDELDNSQEHEYNRILRYKRAIEPIVRGPYNANKQSRYVELVLVADNRLYKELGESISKVEKHCKDITNIINGLYAPLNIFIALVGVVVWSEYDEVDFSTDGDTTLTNFLHYRRKTLIKDHPNDNAQLITKFNFDNGVVGKALKGPICTYEYSGGVNNNHSPIIGLVATTIAHEMGHNFGMEHDTTECSCPDDRCIMAPSSSTAPPTHWSSCSLEYLALAFEHGMDYCLRNKPEALFDSPVCGNGFVEPGEQCDCGLPDRCDNSCCNPTTCTLNANASCATGECCDLSTCKPKKAGTLCRSAEIECDLPEYCTGQSEYCPVDIYKMDTEVCDGGKAYCYHGFCRTRSDQCKLLWGNTGKSSDDQCYKMNVKGTRHGNCGYNKLSQSYFKCQDEHVLCGMLHCKHLNERLEFGMESVAILSHSFINLKGSIIPCRTAIVDLGLNQVDPGLAPDGAKCGEGKMCVNQKCMPVDSLRKTGHKCPYDCNGNGVCNSLGHCHCKDGFAPPFCDYPGPGGSEDSGPASDPNGQKEFVTAMFIIFLGIIPVFAIFGFLTYYTRHNLRFTWKQSPTTTKSPQKSRGPMSFQSDTLKRPTEDIHSLLAEDNTSPLHNDFFGQFKGFTISPKKENPTPVRPAPPVPVAPAVIIKSPILNHSKSSCTKGTVNKSVIRTQSCKPKSLNGAINEINSASVAPALPPLNPGAHPRPIISSPILENSTCTAKELISPLKNAPKIPIRPAPEAPAQNATNKRPLSITAEGNVSTVTEEKKKPGNSALNRIASFLKSNDKKQQPGSTNSLPRHAANTSSKPFDKNFLRSVEISNPIPQTNIDITVATLPVDTEENKAVVMRTQSMRGTNITPRPTITTFGSMRQTNLKRPVSIPSGSRPKSPPPPRPTIQETSVENKKPSIIKVPGFPKPHTQKSQNQYDDCLNGTSPKTNDAKSPSCDNIYAVIEESPVNSMKTSPDSKVVNVVSNSGSSESFGLLGEIVSEIQNRNFDSIYSTSTLARKKKLESEALNKNKNDTSDIYVNTSPSCNSSEEAYSNMNNGKSSASSTSSGYINPSAVNVPPKTVHPNVPPKTVHTNATLTKPLIPNKTVSPSINKPTLSTFKTDIKNESGRPSSVHRNSGTFTPNFKTTTSSNVNDLNGNNENSKSQNKPQVSKGPKVLDRQITPPNLRSRKPSPTRKIVNSSPKTSSRITKATSNSPDLVTSCSTTKKPSGNKTPDVLNGSIKKAASISAKPNIPNLPKTATKVNKSVSLKSPLDIKTCDTKPATTKLVNSDVTSKELPSGARLAARQNSSVATLQQKFENKTPISAKTINAKK